MGGMPLQGAYSREFPSLLSALQAEERGKGRSLLDFLFPVILSGPPAHGTVTPTSNSSFLGMSLQTYPEVRLTISLELLNPARAAA